MLSVRNELRLKKYLTFWPLSILNLAICQLKKYTAVFEISIMINRKFVALKWEKM